MNRTDFLKKLLAEVVPLQSGGILDETSATRLRAYCEAGLETGNQDVRRILRLFLVLIAVALVGVGIGLLISHNWDMLPPWARLSMGFGPLLVAMAAGVETLRHDRRAAWRECSALGVALMTAASIAIVSQLYHLSGTFGDFMRVNLVLMLPLIYLFRANALSGLYVLGMFALLDHWRPGGYWDTGLPFLLGVLPYLGWRLRQVRTGALAYYLEAVTLAAVLEFIIGASILQASTCWTMTLLAAISAFVYAVGVYWRRYQYHNLFAVSGALALFVMAFIAATPNFWRWGTATWPDPVYWCIVVLPAIGVLVLLARLRTAGIVFAAAGIPVPLMSFLLSADQMTILVNALLVVCGGVYFWRGIVLRNRGLLNLALGIFLLLAFFRMLDFRKDILLYAVGFIVAGLLFFGINLLIGHCFKKMEHNGREVNK